MQPDAKTLFLEALERTTQADRVAYLDAACRDAAMRRRVESLLLAHAASDPLLDRPAAEHLAEVNEMMLVLLDPSDNAEALGRLGHYDVLECVGHGGMGIVFRAFDSKLHRMVAIKALAPLLASHPPTRQQFLQEARAAAAIVHEHVVPIHAVEDTSAVPYFVMQFVQGSTLQDKIDRTGPLPLTEILRIGQQVALGLAAVHRGGLIHRDVKPANILLENGVERVLLADFGLASASNDVSIARGFRMAGTPAYMSPEQVTGQPLTLRSDLYSLGGSLYAMATGRAPFERDTEAGVPIIGPRPMPSMRELNPAIPPWFVTMVERLMARQPEDRFSSADEVAESLRQRLVELQRSQALPQLLSNHRRQLALAAALVIMMLVGWSYWPSASGENEPTSLSTTATPQVEHVLLKPARTLTGHTAGVLTVAFSPTGKMVASSGEDRTILLWDLEQDTSRSIPSGHQSNVVSLAFSPRGNLLSSVASGNEASSLRLWSVATGQLESTLGGPHTGMWCGAWSADGTKIAAAGWDKTLQIWNVAARTEHLVIPEVCTRFARGVVFSPKGDRIITGGSGVTRLWDTTTGKEVVTAPMPEMCPMYLSNDKVIGWGYWTGRVIICDIPTGKVRMEWFAHRGIIEGLAVSPDGRFVLSFSPDGLARLWNVSGTEPIEIANLIGHRGAIYYAAFSPDGSRLATAGMDDLTVRLWDLPAICRVRNP